MEFPKAYQKVRVCRQTATVQQPQSLLQNPLFDRCSSNEERGFTSSVHLQTSASYWISKIFEGDWQIRKDFQKTQALPAQLFEACCNIPQNLQLHQILLGKLKTSVAALECFTVGFFTGEAGTD